MSFDVDDGVMYLLSLLSCWLGVFIYLLMLMMKLC